MKEIIKKRTIRKAIKIAIDTFSAIVGLVFVVSMCALDSETWIPVICTVISGAWLTFYAYCKDWFYTGKGEEHVK